MKVLVSLFAVVPLPGDIPLPLPLPEWLLVFLLVVSFLLHILFVNLMLGGTILALWAEIKGLKEPGYDGLAREIAATITVNKSLAVVIGVAPLLVINALYTLYFYTANSLTGTMWIAIVPFVGTAFLLLYFHKYTWDRYRSKKAFHIFILALALLVFLFVPLIFLTNINLMLFPEKWGTIRGFFSAMWLANVIPRYLHFLCASLAVSGLFLFGYMRRQRYPFTGRCPGLNRARVLKNWYRLAFFASLLQLAFGPLNFFTLPWRAVTWGLAYIVLSGLVFATGALILLYKEINGPEGRLGRYFYAIALLLSITVLFMGTGRHLYRAIALSAHQEKVLEKTGPYQAK